MSGVRIDVTAPVGHAEKGIKSVHGLLTGLGTEAKKSLLVGVGIASGVAAFSLLKNAIGGVTDYLGDSVKAAIDDEQSVSRLGQSLKANIPHWDGNTDAIEKRIEAGQELGFSDDELRASMALLVGATHDVGKAQEIQAAAMDLARLKGISLASASDALVKIEGGRYRILASLGIKLKEGATATEVLAEVQRVAAGQAEAFGETTAGAAAAAGIAFEELSEDVGRQLMPIFRDLAKFARDDLIPALRDIGKFIGDLVGTMGDIGQAWATVGMDFGSMGQKIHDIADRTGDDYQTVKDRIKGYMLDMGMSFDEAVAKAGGAGREILAEGARWAGIAAAELAAGAPLVAAAGETTFVEPITDEMRKATEEARALARALPGKIADALRGQRDNWRQAMEDLATDVTDTLSNSAERAALLGALHSSELARGLRDSRPLVKAAALEAQLEIIYALQAAGVPFAVWGANIGTAWYTALVGSLAVGKKHVATQLSGFREMMHGYSPPKQGPLKDIDKGGFNIGKAWADAFGLGMSGFKVPSLPSMGLPNVNGGGMAFAGGGAVGGAPVVIQLQVDGRTLAEIVDRNLYYQGSGSSRFPRG